MTARFAILATLTACALTSKSQPRVFRYFAPPPTGASLRASSPSGSIQLGHVVAAAHLRASIEHRTSEIEIAPYETLRWTELPDVYVHRALVHALFESGAFDQAVDGVAPTLDVEIVAFEEAGHAGRVQLRYELHDDHRVLARGLVAVDRQAAGTDILDVVRAIGAAMDAACTELATRLASR